MSTEGLPRGTIVVVYDISQDWRRQLMAERLRPMADWAQNSTWLVPPTLRLTASRVFGRLAGLCARGDRLRVFHPCTECLRRARWLPADPAPLAWRSGYVLSPDDG